MISLNLHPFNNVSSVFENQNKPRRLGWRSTEDKYNHHLFLVRHRKKPWIRVAWRFVKMQKPVPCTLLVGHFLPTNSTKPRHLPPLSINTWQNFSITCGHRHLNELLAFRMGQSYPRPQSIYNHVYEWSGSPFGVVCISSERLPYVALHSTSSPSSSVNSSNTVNLSLAAF
jgi:hypothetical protein